MHVKFFPLYFSITLSTLFVGEMLEACKRPRQFPSRVLLEFRIRSDAREGKVEDQTRSKMDLAGLKIQHRYIRMRERHVQLVPYELPYL